MINKPANKKSKTEFSFYQITPLKLYVLSVLTFSGFFIFWSYYNWSVIKDYEQSRIHPLIRAFFYPFWSYSLLSKMSEISKDPGNQSKASSQLLGTLLALISLLFILSISLMFLYHFKAPWNDEYSLISKVLHSLSYIAYVIIYSDVPVNTIYQPDLSHVFNIFVGPLTLILFFILFIPLSIFQKSVNLKNNIKNKKYKLRIWSKLLVIIYSLVIFIYLGLISMGLILFESNYIKGCKCNPDYTPLEDLLLFPPKK